MFLKRLLAVSGSALLVSYSGCGGGGDSPVNQPLRVNNFAVDGTNLIDTRSGEPLFLKGIGYSPFRPGETPVFGGNLSNDIRYFNDLNLIKALNANFIVFFPQFGPFNFFTALDEAGINYSQDIFVDGLTNDLLDPNFQRLTIDHMKRVIDHTYTIGRPDRLVFFSVGDEVNAGTIFRTDTRHPEVTSFTGNHISILNRTPSEVAIATLMDAAITHEVTTYGVRHLYTHTSFTHIGPVANRPDLEVSPGSVFFADFGDLICMNIYTYARGVVTSPPGSVTGTTYQGYLEELARISQKPIIITQVGLSTSPVAPNPAIPGFGGNAVGQVANTLTQVREDVRTASGANKFAGLAFFEFHDEWWKNGEELSDETSHNVNDPEEWFGIFQFDNNFTLVTKGIIFSTIQTLFSQ